MNAPDQQLHAGCMNKIMKSFQYTTRHPEWKIMTLIRKALDESWIIITNDKDFGEKVYREGHLHKGVVLLRLGDERSVSKIETLQRLLKKYADRLPDHFVVVTEKHVRFAHKSAL
jgi:predicted nuclease of predicted toxin-antitoxin system